MPNELPETDLRLRLQRVSQVLRQFGLNDPGSIRDAMHTLELPSLAKVTKLVASSYYKLPPSISAEFVAKCILSSLAEIDADTSAWRERYAAVKPRLSSIPPGNKAAPDYHNHVLELLRAAFDGILSNPHKEQPQHGGVNRIDITFDNTSQSGFFAQLASKHGIPSHCIPFECKNYDGDLGNPEYDQISGRLDSRTNAIGFLVFRKILDTEKARQHCQTKLAKGEYVLLLNDQDVCNLYKARLDGKPSQLDAILRGKLRALKLGAAQ